MSTPRYRQLAAELRRMIKGGVLAHGDRLPSVRALARAKRVSVTTALEAYRLLEADGSIEARPRSGFYVCFKPPSGSVRMEVAGWRQPVPARLTDTMPRMLAEQSDSGFVVLSTASSDPNLLPAGMLERATRDILRKNYRQFTGYGDPQGDMILRRQIVDIMLERGVVASPADITVTSGCQEALYLALNAISSPNQIVAVESPTYPGLLHVLHALGLKVLEIPSDTRTGIDLDALDSALDDTPIAACYVTPRCSNPIGSSMPVDHGKRLYAMACAHDFKIIEDDANWGLSHSGTEPPTIKSLDDNRRVLYCSSLSKTLSPGLRVGWLVADKDARRIAESKYVLNLGGVPLSQLAAARYLSQRRFKAVVDANRSIHAKSVAALRRAVLNHFPQGTETTDPEGGVVIWVRLPDQISGRRLRDVALGAGISIAPGDVFSAADGYRDCIRLGWGGVWNDRAERAVMTLGELCGSLVA